MKINPQIFRKYDIRGIVDEDLSEDFAYLLGRAYAHLAQSKNKDNIAVGWDCRNSSPAYAQALAHGITAEGLNVMLSGMGPTPQLYYAIFAKQLGGGIQITGSHNPSNMNGFKICLETKTLSGEEIQTIKAKMEELINCPVDPSKEKPVSELNIQPQYIEELVNNCQAHMGARKLKVVVDAGNGVGAVVGPQVLKQLGVDVVELYCEPDGNFPNHHPDPTELKNLEDLIAKVKEEKADFGIGWDGDADRIGVVDENGKVIFGDMLLLIYAREILKEKKDLTIIGDVKCSNRLFDDLNSKGAKAIMWKTGHSLIKGKLQETKADLAGEMSGHIFFKHRYYGYDDAVYASARLIELMSNCDQPISELISDLPAMISTPEIRLDCPEELKFKIPELAKEAFADYELSDIDGIRISFEHGWGLVRASNTQPVLVMRFEATSEKLLNDYQNLVTERIEKIKASISYT